MKYVIVLLLTFNLFYAQTDVPLTLLTQFNGTFGYTIIGKTLNEFDNRKTPPPPCQILTQSSATLNLLPSQTIVAAYLYWGGIGDGTFDPNVKLNGITYAAAQTSVCNPHSDDTPEQVREFNSFQDVTSQVIATGNGVYTFSDLDLNPIIDSYLCSSKTFNAGWHIVVIYNQSTLENTLINIYDGLSCISAFFGPGGYNSFPLSDLDVVDTENAKLSIVALNGSPLLYYNEQLNINFWGLGATSQNPFNGTNTFTGSTTNYNQDIDTFDISQFINVGDTQATIGLGSLIPRYVQTIVTSIRSLLPDATVDITQVTGQEICNNRDLAINYTVSNLNCNAPLPANAPVSFYANNTLIQTIYTPSSIAIDDSLPLSTTLSIPPSIPYTFTLKVIVDDSLTITERHENNNEATQEVTLLESTIVPNFTFPNTFCKDSTIPTLPSLSDNGIAGTWSPNAVNNQANGAYVFTPNVGQCALPLTLNITISTIINPNFNLPNGICLGGIAPTLPSISIEGISGTWSPNTINNQTDGTYIFTPNPNQCALPFTLNVIVATSIPTIFNIQNNFCQGETVPNLLATSDNGISGTWLPNSINNQTSGSYTFTPNADQCGTIFTLNTTIIPQITPVFTIQNTFCQGSIVPVLPAISNNSISGSWFPAVISNQTSGSYIFTPDAGICASLFTLTITVEAPSVTFQNLLICEDELGNTIFPIALNTGLNSTNYTFKWFKDGNQLTNTSSSLTAFETGNYEAIATILISGCEKQFTFQVTPLQPLLVNILVKENFESNQTIEAQVIGGSGQYAYSFNAMPFQDNNTYYVTEGGDVEIIVKDKNGCYTFSKTVTIWQYPRFFTPNGDGYNDTWGINTQQNISIEIFDRYGKVIKQLHKNESWDGTYNSRIVPSTDYWFVLYYNNKTFKSHFSLKR